jgi:glycosyltransferase involved in cell wall biosynthesis
MPAGTEIDEFVTWGTPSSKHQLFSGRSWRVVPSCLADSPASATEQAIADLRKSRAGRAKTVLATFARTEKVNQPSFLDAVIKILLRRPECVFLWTGQLEHTEVTRAFQNAGIVDQVRFIGWVDTRMHARIVDVLLDSFPLANGITALHAMAEGVPVVSIWGPTSLVGRDVLPMRDGSEDIPLSGQDVTQELRTLFFPENGDSPACEDVNDYVDFAIRLIDDDAFRSDTGRKFKSFHQLLYSNESLMSEIFVDHVREISDAHRRQK